MLITINDAKTLILSGQCLLEKDKNQVVQVVSDLSGIQYDPCPILHLNHYLVLWSRVPGFKVTDYDRIAYEEKELVEASLFKRNLFIAPTGELDIYNAATERIVRWGNSREQQKRERQSNELLAEEEKLRQAFHEMRSCTKHSLWEHLGLAEEWKAYRQSGKQGLLKGYLPIFQVFHNMRLTNDIIVCNRLHGTFREPVFALREDLLKDKSSVIEISNNDAVEAILYKLICSFGITEITHMKAITGLNTEDISMAIASLRFKRLITDINVEGLKKTYVAANKLLAVLQQQGTRSTDEVSLLSPMEGIIRDKRWLNTFFSYSFSFEYFKKKGMKWPLSILVGNKFVGYFDCKMEWRTKNFIIKEKNIFDSAFIGYKEIDLAIQDLAAFHNAKDIVENK
ncbi:MAG: winged helix DNA-binding domain-containing protein [Oscillospiraceae bacterium]|nr:winged helix DNA-binding domain-containing protein [Oscillospiraceae bacterium]